MKKSLSKAWILLVTFSFLFYCSNGKCRRGTDQIADFLGI